MKRNKKRIIAAVAVIGALAAGGAAYTQSVDTSTTTGSVAGYGSLHVTGTNSLASVSYTFSNDGSEITAVNLTFGTALTGQDVQVGFDDQVTQSSGTMTDCGDTTGTSATCTLAPAEATNDAANLNVLVKAAS
jgi:hypothetical protein